MAEEKVKLLKRAAARPEWQTAAWAARLALNTTMRECEITCSGCEADTAEIKSPFHGYRFHDLRHQAITELAESKASVSRPE